VLENRDALQNLLSDDVRFYTLRTNKWRVTHAVALAAAHTSRYCTSTLLTRATMLHTVLYCTVYKGWMYI
jgi:hypothetical protein